MWIQTTIRGGIGLVCLSLGQVWVSTAQAQPATGSSGGTFTVQPMLVPMMTTNGQTANPADPFQALNNPLYGMYGGMGMGMGMGMTNQQMGMMMLTTPGRMGGLGSGRLSGVHPDPLAPKMTKGRQQALAAAERDPSPVRRATRPAGTGSASRYFGRQSPSQMSEPRGRFDRPARYFP